jgi:hypothetical protein
LIVPEKHKRLKKKKATQLRVMVSLLMDSKLNLKEGTYRTLERKISGEICSVPV